MSLASVFRPALLLFGLTFMAFFSPAVLGQPGSTAADGFNPNVDGNVFAVAVQPDGKVIIAGKFETIRPGADTQATARTNIARLLPDGRNDPSFNANNAATTGMDGEISTVVLQPNGQILIGGKFTTVAGTTRRRLARLNTDGTLDASFDPNIEPRAPTEGGSLTPEVTSIALQPDGRIVVGGGFTAVQPNGAAELTVRNRLARFNSDGSLDTTFNPSANSMVLSLALQPDGKILVGGGFTTLQSNGAAGSIPGLRLARLNADGTLDTSFDPRPNNAVSAIAVLPDGSILIGGTFTRLQPGGGDEVTTNVNRLARLTASGTVSSGFFGNADGPVSTIVLQPDGGILVGGSFATLGTGAAAYVGRLMPNGALDGSFVPGPNFTVHAIALQPDGSVILGGGFTTLGSQGRTNVVRNRVARVSFRGALDADFRPDVNGRLNSLIELDGGRMLVGGSFTSLAGQTYRGMVLLNADGSVDPAFRADANGPVVAAVQVGTQIIVAGSFTRINGVTRSNLARLNADGSVDVYNPAPNAQVNALLRQGDKLIIGGSFTSLRPFDTTEAVARSRLARLNADGTLDLSFTAQSNETVLTLVEHTEGKFIAGGAFSTVAGTGATSLTTRYGMARFNSDGTVDDTFDPNVNGTVRAIAVQSDGKVIFGGAFAQIAPNRATAATTRNNIARLAANGDLDADFDPATNGAVNSIELQSDGKILIGGRFTILRTDNAPDGIDRLYAARLEENGNVDEDFNFFLDRLPGNEVVGIIVTASDNIVLAGTFNQVGVNGVRRSRIARVNTAGVVDTAFNTDLSAGGGADIRALTQQFGGHVLVAGEFSSLAGTGGTNMARFFADSSPDSSFVPNLDGPVYVMAEAPQKGTPISTQHSGFAWLGSSGELQPGFAFDPALTSLVGVRAVAVDDNGKVLISATTTISGATTSLVRYNADGSIDSTFQRLTSGTIYAIQVLSDGKILIGGAFTTVGTTARGNIARLNADGTLDTTFSTSVDNNVYEIAVQDFDNKILIGGDFSSVTGSGATAPTARNAIARLNADGTVDTAFDPNPNGAVQLILIQSGGSADRKIVVGGGFTGFRPNGATTTIDRGFLARLNTDGTIDTTATNLDVNGFIGTGGVQSDGKIVIGGFFTRVGGQTRNHLARLEAETLALDEGFNPNANSPINALTVQGDDKILIAGTFTALQPGGSIYDPTLATPRNRLARLEPNGQVDESFNPNFNGQVTTVTAFPGGSVIATGAFTTIQPTGSLMIGGSFSTINNVAALNLAVFGNDGSVSAAFRPNPNGAVHALLPRPDGSAIVGGAFTAIAGADRNRLARFNQDDSLDTTFNPNADNTVLSLAAQSDGKLLVGGRFQNIAGTARAYLARLNADGSIDGSFAPTVPGEVTGIAVQPDGRILVLAAGSGVRSVLLRLTAQGGADASFAAVNGGSAAINAFALQTDGRIAVGGAFTALAGGARSYLARLNADGSLDPTVDSTPNGEVTAVTVQRDGKLLIGGRFTAVDDLPRFGLARIATATSNTGASAFSTNAQRTSITWIRSGVGPEVSGMYFESSTNLADWTTVGEGSRVPNTSDWQVSGITLPAEALYVRASAIVPSTPNSSSGLIEAQGRIAGTVPAITSPTVVSTGSGSPFLYAASVANGPASYSASGLPPGLTISGAGLISGTPTQTGTFNVLLAATNAAGTSTTMLTLVVGAPAPTSEAGKVLNISVRAQLGASNPVVINGFVIRGSGPQSILLRAVGPSLSAVGITSPLAQPVLRLYSAAGEVLQENDRWGGSSELATEFARLGAQPLAGASSEDSALLVTLSPGVYTMHVANRGTVGGTVLAEVYDASPWPPAAGAPRLVNISGRGIVSPGNPVIGGFVIGGDTPRQMLIRGIGPGLTPQNVPDVLANPQLTLHRNQSGTTTVVAQNDDWSTPVTVVAEHPGATAAAISAAGTTTGAFALGAGSTDAAILVTLPPGVYTAQVSGPDGASGATLVEVYEVP